MRLLRSVASPFIFLACLGVSLAAAWEVWKHGIPEEDPQGRAAREREIATQEVALMVNELASGFLARLQPPEEQYAFVDRMDFYVRRGAEVVVRPSDFNGRQRGRLRENAERVAQVWLRSRANRYDRLPPREQRAFINEQIAALQGWAPFAALAFGFEPVDAAMLYQLDSRFERPPRGGIRDPRIDDARRAMRDLQDWAATSLKDDQRRRVLHFVEALQERFVSPLAAPR